MRWLLWLAVSGNVLSVSICWYERRLRHRYYQGLIEQFGVSIGLVTTYQTILKELGVDVTVESVKTPLGRDIKATITHVDVVREQVH